MIYLEIIAQWRKVYENPGAGSDREGRERG